MPRFETPQKRGAEKASDHGAAPIEGHKSRGRPGGEASNLRKAEITYQKASDGNFRAYVSENPNRGEDEVGMFPNRIVGLLSGTELRMLDFGQPKCANHNR